MKVAIIHYWLVTMRGGEKVVEELLRIFPEIPAGILAPLHYFIYRIQVVDVRSFPYRRPGAFGNGAASDAVDRPFIPDIAAAVHGFESHAVRVECQKGFRPPDNVHLFLPVVRKRIRYGHICKVSFSCGCQTAVQYDFELPGFRMLRGKHGRSFCRPHRMAARRASSYLV